MYLMNVFGYDMHSLIDSLQIKDNKLIVLHSFNDENAGKRQANIPDVKDYSSNQDKSYYL